MAKTAVELKLAKLKVNFGSKVSGLDIKVSYFGHSLVHNLLDNAISK